MVKHEPDAYSFRLSQGDEAVYSDTSTVSSTHKKRIDSLFRDRRSRPLPPEPAPHPVREELERMFGGREGRQRAFLDVRATVQAQIERLFADATSEPLLPPAPRPSPPAPRLPSPDLETPPPVTPQPSQPPTPSPPASSVGGRSGGISPAQSEASSGARPTLATMKYPVDYLGSQELIERATSLDVLQAPLRDLYYKYRLSISRGARMAPGSLQITEGGLRIVQGGHHRPGEQFCEFTNPFPTIAVWAAVKLVIRREGAELGRPGYSYAFLPLICDPEAQDKYDLYHPLEVPEPGVMAAPHHPPMFACVMRKVGVPRVLECHGFVCQSAEDAIVMAANLYQALLENMRSEIPSDAPSEASSDPRDDDRHVMSDSEAVPVRPPRRKRSSRRAQSPGRGLRRASSEDLLQTQVVLDSTRASSRLKRSISDRHGSLLVEAGDVYTRVALPRSKSFMNVTNKYNFQDLLDDVKRKTGLSSVDEVLKQVISPRGMSFSEMDPDRREILLKLALTLSKDEIYQRSKSILRQQTRARTSTSTRSLSRDSDSEGSTISSVLKATKRSFSRLGSRASSIQSSYLKDKSPLRKLVNTGGSSKSRYSIERASRASEVGSAGRGDNKENELSHLLEGSSGSGRKSAPKTPMPRRNPSRAAESTYMSCSECGYDSECSSKCYCSLPRSSRPPGQPRGGPCDCDTESCAESEKCYCSLKRVKKNGLKMYEINLDSETDTNTESTVRSITAASYKKGFGSHSNLSELESRPATSWRRDTGGSSSSAARHKSSSSYLTENSKSRSAGTVFSLHPEAMRNKSLSSSLSTDSDTSVAHPLSDGSDYQNTARRRLMHQRAASTESLLTSPRMRRHSGSLGSRGSSQGSGGSGRDTHRSQRSQASRTSSASHQKILLVSAVDPSGKVVYRGASQRQKRDDTDTASILSMKKTAEIAALFSELKLSQTTDLINQLQQSASESEDDAYSSMQANNSFLFSDNIETSLGYLP